MDAAGQATVTWLRNEAPPGHVLETRTLDTQGPLATGLSIPTATVGQARHASVGGDRRVVPRLVDRVVVGRRRRRIGASVTRTFAAVGSYAVSVTATDAVGNATTLTGTVVVSPTPPVTAPTTPTTPTTPSTPMPPPILSGVKLTKKTIHVVGSDENSYGPPS